MQAALSDKLAPHNRYSNGQGADRQQAKCDFTEHVVVCIRQVISGEC